MTTQMTAQLISPYGDRLVDLLVPPDSRDEFKQFAGRLPSVQLSPRSACDLELIATGGFSPLDTFMGQEDHRRVLDEMRLTSGYLFPVPVTLPIDPDPAITIGADVTLRDETNQILAVMTVEEMYRWDLDEVASKVFRTRQKLSCFSGLAR